MAATCLVTGGSGFVGGRLIERLVSEGWHVRALARGDAAARSVSSRGAQAVRGSLEDADALAAAVAGCSVVFHVAALFKLWGDAAEFEQANVAGTGNLLRAARDASVRRFVQLGAAAVVLGEPRPLLGATEALPRQERPWAPYSSSKARSEALVLGANRPGAFETVVVRPPMIWGAGMPMLDQLVDGVQAGDFRWPGDGAQAMSTAHVDNVCRALELAAASGVGGQAYFVSDGADQALRPFLSALLRTRQIEPPTATVPMRLAWLLAGAMEWLWRTFARRGEPPITRQMLSLIGAPFTLDIGKAERELGYRPLVTPEQGLRAMRGA